MTIVIGGPLIVGHTQQTEPFFSPLQVGAVDTTGQTVWASTQPGGDAVTGVGARAITPIAKGGFAREPPRIALATSAMPALGWRSAGNAIVTSQLVLLCPLASMLPAITRTAGKDCKFSKRCSAIGALPRSVDLFAGRPQEAAIGISRVL